jgi:tRNA (guanine37-N1)-methyltransferase
LLRVLFCGFNNDTVFFVSICINGALLLAYTKKMRFDVVSLFPQMFPGPLQDGVTGRALRNGVLEIYSHNLRDWGLNQYHQVDDTPYGGGAGMVIRPEPVFAAVESLQEQGDKAMVVMMTPQGKKLSAKLAQKLAGEKRIIILSGRYEGFDERIREELVDYEVSIGDYVLSGGELPALVFIDAVSRFVPKVLGDETSALTDSFSDGLLEHPHYTKPAEFRGKKVPEVLLSGNHKAIDDWRKKESIKRTKERRQDLLQSE